MDFDITVWVSQVHLHAHGERSKQSYKAVVPYVRIQNCQVQSFTENVPLACQAEMRELAQSMTGDEAGNITYEVSREIYKGSSIGVCPWVDCRKFHPAGVLIKQAAQQDDHAQTTKGMDAAGHQCRCKSTGPEDMFVATWARANDYVKDLHRDLATYMQGCIDVLGIWMQLLGKACTSWRRTVEGLPPNNTCRLQATHAGISAAYGRGVNVSCLCSHQSFFRHY